MLVCQMLTLIRGGGGYINKYCFIYLPLYGLQLQIVVTNFLADKVFIEDEDGK